MPGEGTLAWGWDDMLWLVGTHGATSGSRQPDQAPAMGQSSIGEGQDQTPGLGGIELRAGAHPECLEVNLHVVCR